MSHLEASGQDLYRPESTDHARGWRVARILRGDSKLQGARVSVRLRDLKSPSFYPYGRWLLPTAFATRFEAPQLPYIVDLHYVELDGGPRVSAMQVWPYEAKQVRLEALVDAPLVDITTAGIREIPVQQLKQLGVLAAIHRQPEDKRRRPEPYPLADWNEVYADESRARGSYYLTDERLREIADVYRQALTAGDPPVRAVEQAFGIARSSAGRWVMKAREAGLLSPTERGKARG